MGNTTLARLKFLDALRAIAALSVLTQHTLEPRSLAFAHFTKYFFQFGVFGVTLFFLCSGFIIPVSLEKAKSLKIFWIRRFFRLYPLYIIATIVMVLILKYYYQQNISGLKILLASLMISEPENMRILSISWTLTLEVIFYGLISFLYFTNFYKYAIRNALFMLLIALLNAVLIGKYWGIFLYFATFFMGDIFYKHYKRQITSRQFYSIFILYLITIIVITGSNLYGKDALNISGTHRFVPATLSFLTAYIFFFFALKFRELTIFNNKILLFLGLISYSIYLMQTFIFLLPINSAIIVCLTTLVLATITYNLIEKPFIQIGHKASN